MNLVTIYDEKVFVIDDKQKNSVLIAENAERLLNLMYFNKTLYADEFPMTDDGFFYIHQRDFAEHLGVSQYVIGKILKMLEQLDMIAIRRMDRMSRQYFKINPMYEDFIREQYEEEN